jgi:hypothetical protein
MSDLINPIPKSTFQIYFIKRLIENDIFWQKCPTFMATSLQKLLKILHFLIRCIKT